MRQVEVRIKRSEAMICSMNQKERASPELLLSDRNAPSWLTRISEFRVMVQGGAISTSLL